MACSGRKPWEGAEELGRLSRILIREGGYQKVLGNFYKAVAHAVLVF